MVLQKISNETLAVLRSSTTKVERIETSQRGKPPTGEACWPESQGEKSSRGGCSPPALQISFRLSNSSRLTNEKKPSRLNPSSLPIATTFFFLFRRYSQNGPPFSCLLQLYVLRPWSHAQLAYDTHTVVHGSRDGRPIASWTRGHCPCYELHCQCTSLIVLCHASCMICLL